MGAWFLISIVAVGIGILTNLIYVSTPPLPPPVGGFNFPLGIVRYSSDFLEYFIPHARKIIDDLDYFNVVHLQPIKKSIDELEASDLADRISRLESGMRDMKSSIDRIKDWVGLCEEEKFTYTSPETAVNGPKEEVLYVPCTQLDNTKSDYLATIDVNPMSTTFLQIIHRLEMPDVGDGLHNLIWNSCLRWCNNPGRNSCRDKLILPCVLSDRIYIVDISNDLLAPRLHKVIDPEELHKLDLATPLTGHCLPSGELMISTMRRPNGSSQGSFLLLDVRKDFEVKSSSWSTVTTAFGYDFSYKPFYDTMISSQFGTPMAFNSTVVKEGAYGATLDVWSLSKRKLVQKIDLGANGTMPLSPRFFHNAKMAHGFAGYADSMTVFHFYQPSPGTKWVADEVISIPSKTVNGWMLPEMPAGLTDIVLSMDDKFLYLSNWVHGDIRQYNINDPATPLLTGQVWIGGSIVKGGPVTVVGDSQDQPEQLFIKRRKISGGPQMLQLSLDGKRLYVTTSRHALFWQKQLYTTKTEEGSTLLQIDVNTTDGGLTVNADFLVDFGKEAVLAHEMRYPGGDCTSDIFLSCPS